MFECEISILRLTFLCWLPWFSGCGHCKKMKPEYDEAAEFLNKDPDVSSFIYYSDIRKLNNIYLLKNHFRSLVVQTICPCNEMVPGVKLSL